MGRYTYVVCDRCNDSKSPVYPISIEHGALWTMLEGEGWKVIRGSSYICPDCQKTKYKVAIKTPPAAGGTYDVVHYSGKTFDTPIGAEEEIRMMKLTLPESLWKDWGFEWVPVKE